MCEDLREWMCEESVKKVRVFGLGMLGWMCEESLWEFLSDVMVERILIFFKGVKCYFTDLPLPIKIN